MGPATGKQKSRRTLVRRASKRGRRREDWVGAAGVESGTF
jgi:hypothetical protein